MRRLSHKIFVENGMKQKRETERKMNKTNEQLEFK